MSNYTNENFILKIIRYGPALLIIVTSILTTLYISFYYTSNLENEKEKIRKDYLEFNKEVIQTNIDALSDYIDIKKEQSLNILKKDIKNNVYYANYIINSIYNEFKDTKTKEQITSLIKTILKNIKLDRKAGYYFIYDLNGNCIFHPIDSKREGKNLFYTQDINSSFIVQESINIAKSKNAEGYQTWMFPKPNGSIKQYEKVGFIKAFKPYNWYIGVGEYKVDFDNQVKEEILDHIKELGYKDTHNIFVIDKNNDFLITRTSYSNVNDIDKKNLFFNSFNEFAKSNKNNDFLEYKYLDNKGVQSGKISYLKKIKTYDWIIGTGFNLDNLNIKIKTKQHELEKDYNRHIYVTLITSIFITILLLIISLLLSKLLKKRFLEYKENLEKQITKNKIQKEILLKAQRVAHIGDWKLNIKTNKAFWSDEIIRIFGIDKKLKDQFGPKFLKNLMISDKDRSCFENSMKNCINTGKEHKCIYRIKRPDNEIRWIECRGRLEKNRLAIVGTIQDITENKKLEMEKQQKDEIIYQQNKIVAMGEMISNIAHQWRQPLSVISTAATGLKLQKEANILDDKQLIKSLTAINDSAQYLSNTINDFRDFLSPNNNKIKEFKISDTLKRGFNLVNTKFVSKKIEIIQDIKDFTIVSIENALLQVLINILTNAYDVLETKEDQKRLIFIKTYKKNDSYFIEIKDNAGGIAKDIINRIFEPYFTTKYKSQGTGIGLYMSKEIIKKHLKGDIFVSNEQFTYKNISYVGAKFIVEIISLKS